MPEHFIFYVVFLGQILLISFYYPKKILARMRHVFETYPPQDYPKLYPKPIEHYKKVYRNFLVLNIAILLAGLALIAFLWGYPRTGAWDKAIATWYFLLQFFPMLLLEFKSLREFKLMRKSRSDPTRKAVLQRRRFFDFISPGLFGLAVLTYIGFILMIIYVNQFDYSWFGGYANIVGITGMNLFFAAIVYWNMRGKKLNPHQSPDDRNKQTGILVKVMVVTSIAATVFVSISIMLSALDMRELQVVVQCLYFQLLAVISFQTLRTDDINFDVYKDDGVVT